MRWLIAKKSSMGERMFERLDKTMIEQAFFLTFVQHFFIQIKF